ncbi:hypothetical protein ACFFNA_39015, partial [Mesorhizobium kowhaii]
HGSIKMAALEHDKLPESRSSRHAAMTFPKSLRRNHRINWMFSTENARLKMAKAYPKPTSKES